MVRWVKRKGHRRVLRSGKVVNVDENYAAYEENRHTKPLSYHLSCPRCGEDIIRVRMPNGGWGHFEGKLGLTKIKHRCFTFGDGLKGRDDQTIDMFSAQE